MKALIKDNGLNTEAILSATCQQWKTNEEEKERSEADKTTDERIEESDEESDGHGEELMAEKNETRSRMYEEMYL